MWMVPQPKYDNKLAGIYLNLFIMFWSISFSSSPLKKWMLIISKFTDWDPLLKDSTWMRRQFLKTFSMQEHLLQVSCDLTSFFAQSFEKKQTNAVICRIFYNKARYLKVHFQMSKLEWWTMWQPCFIKNLEFSNFLSSIVSWPSFASIILVEEN